MIDILSWRTQARNLEGKQAVVVGAGKSGQAAARLLLRFGAKVRLLDANENFDTSSLGDLADKLELVLGNHNQLQFAGAAMVILSPGVPVRKLKDYLSCVPEHNVMSELEFAARLIDEPIVAVTGTNGKTTTTELLAHIFKTAGKKVFTGGNIGTPLSEYILNREWVDIVVLEVSSFQLQNCLHFRPEVGLLLNFSPNHLDYHQDMEEYLAAKLNLFKRQTSDDYAIIPVELHELLEKRNFTKAKVILFKPTNRFPGAGLTGEHNRSNMEAAWAAARIMGVDLDTAAKAMATYKAPPHRLEVVAEKDGRVFVDDSKATTLDAVRAAVLSFDRPVRLLAGGVFKGGSVEDLAEAMLGRVVEVGLFGQSREIFEKALADRFNVFWEPTLKDAVRKMYDHSAKGDVILLSPATASFDLYKSYAERGDDFQKVVKEL